MSTATFYPSKFRRSRWLYPDTGDSTYFWIGRNSSDYVMSWLYFEDITATIPSGSTIDSAYLKLKQRYGGYSAELTFRIMFCDDQTWSDLTYNDRGVDCGAGYVQRTLSGINAGLRSFDIKTLVQWLIDNDDPAPIVEMWRPSGVTTDIKYFEEDPVADSYIVVNYTLNDPPDAGTIGDAHWVDATHASLEWTNPTTGGGPTTIDIYVSEDSGAYVKSNKYDLDPETTSVSDLTISASHTYEFKVRWINGAGYAESSASNEVGDEYLITVNGVPEGCSVEVDDGVDTAVENRGASSTVLVDCCLLTPYFDSVSVYSLPDAAGDVLCDLDTGDHADLDYEDEFNMAGSGYDALRVTNEDAADESTIDVAPDQVIVTADDITLDGDVAITGAVDLTDPSCIADYIGARSHVFVTGASGSQTCGTGATVTVKFTTVVHDTRSEYSTSTGYFTADEDGLYRFMAEVNLAGPFGFDNDDYVRCLAVWDSGSINGPRLFGGGSGNTYPMGIVYGCIPMEAGEDLYIQFNHNTDATRTINDAAASTWLAIDWVGPLPT